jgi:hypothetical protein
MTCGLTGVVCDCREGSPRRVANHKSSSESTSGCAAMVRPWPARNCAATPGGRAAQGSTSSAKPALDAPSSVASSSCSTYPARPSRPGPRDKERMEAAPPLACRASRENPPRPAACGAMLPAAGARSALRSVLPPPVLGGGRTREEPPPLH